MQPNIQGYNSYSSLNITFAKIAFFQIGPGGTSTSTSTTSTSTSSIATTSIPSSGGGGGGRSTGENRITIINTDATEAIKELAEAIKSTVGQNVVYQDVLSKNPYRLSIILLTFIFIFLLTIRITKFIKLKKHAAKHRIKRSTHKLKKVKR